jgi:hypothetical protein
MRNLVVIGLIAVATQVVADALPELTEFKKEMNSSSALPVFQENFEGDLNNWMLPPGFTVQAGVGRNYSKTLSRVSKSKADYRIAHYKVKNLEPGVEYLLSGWARGEGYGGSPMAIEFYKDNTYISGSYYPIGGNLSDNQWHEMKYRFTAPATGVDTVICLFITDNDRQEQRKQVQWDDLKIVRHTDKGAVLYVMNVKNLQLDDSGVITFGQSLIGGTAKEKDELALEVEINGVKKLLRAEKGLYQADFGKFPGGEVNVDAKLLNLKNKTIVAEETFRLYSPSLEKPPTGAAYIDRHGRTMVDGKPFFPVGIYASDLLPEDMKILSACGINCVLPYEFTITYRPLGTERPNTFKRMTEDLDTLQQYNLKLIVPLLNYGVGGNSRFDAWQGSGADVIGKFADTVKRHPAMLGYYISDELPQKDMPKRKAVREVLAKVDPFHFVLAVAYVPDEFAFHRTICDVFGYDSYPITSQVAPEMRSSRIELERLNKMDAYPLWFVSQAFAADGVVMPTQEQILSHALLGIVKNAKGSLLYAYNCNANSDAIHRGKILPGIAATAKQLNELAPWVLSLEQAPAVKVEPLVKNESITDAKAFSVEGKSCLVITATGPGAADSMITVEGVDDLKSKYGKTQNLGGGRYHFVGKDICADVLFQNPPVNLRSSSK